MINKDIKNVYFQNNGASALYCGSTLIWKKEEENVGEDYIPKYNFSGKFTDNSTSDDWWYCANDSSSNKVSIADKVNPQTKIFDFNLEDNSNFRNYFINNDKLEIIYNIPINENTKDISYCFNRCTNLKLVKNIKDWNIENITSINGLFYNCAKLENVDGVENFKFNNKISNISQLFGFCQSLKEIKGINKWNVGNITSINQLVYYCINLKELDLSNWDISSLTDLSQPFSDLETLIISNWDFKNVTKNINNFFNLESLTNIIGPIYNIKVNVKTNEFSSKLTNDSAIVLIKGLSEDIEETRTINFNKNVYDTLTEEQIALATSKGWSVVRS